MVRDVVDVPVICAGRMDDPDMAAEAIEKGETDMIGLGRPLLADPEYVNKLRSGRMKSIRPCISCHEGCMGRMQKYMLVNCAVNPQAGRERAMALTPILEPKRVLIVGGGVSGCEAARVLALRGHKPVLFEKGGRLGGNLIPGGAPDFKNDDIALADWYEHTLDRLRVPVHFNAELTKGDVLGRDVDAVIIATGSVPKVFRFADDSSVYTAQQVLLKQVDPGQKIVIIGGGLVGCETALWLSQLGKNVTIVEAQDQLLALNGPICDANKEMLERLIPFHGIQTELNATASDYSGGVLSLDTPEGKKAITCDSLILSVGYAENADLYHELEFEVPEIYLIGDAKKVANIMYAIWDAYEVANHI